MAEGPICHLCETSIDIDKTLYVKVQEGDSVWMYMHVKCYDPSFERKLAEPKIPAKFMCSGCRQFFPRPEYDKHVEACTGRPPRWL
jgi:hypothetical protein